MRILLTILLAALVFGDLRGEQTSDSDSTGVALAVFPDGTTLNLGNVRPGKSYEGEVRIVNGGDAPLIIKRVFSDCGCTIAEYPRNPIAPGDTSAIKLTYNSGERGIGNFIRTLRVETNTKGRRNIIFVKGVIKR